MSPPRVVTQSLTKDAITKITGKIAKLTVKLGEMQLTEADRKEMHERVARAKD